MKQLLLMIVLSALTLNGCGRKGAPQQPSAALSMPSDSLLVKIG